MSTYELRVKVVKDYFSTTVDLTLVDDRGWVFKIHANSQQSPDVVGVLSLATPHIAPALQIALGAYAEDAAGRSGDRDIWDYNEEGEGTGTHTITEAEAAALQALRDQNIKGLSFPQ